MEFTLATSATLSLSHCRWLRISGESVFDHHRPLDTGTIALSFNMKSISCIHSGNLSNAVLVSLPLAQNQRGKRFRSSQARSLSTLIHIMAFTLATSATLSLSHCRWLRISGESVFDHHRPLSTRTIALSFNIIAFTLATSATLSLSHCRWLRISGESVFDHHRPLDTGTIALSFNIDSLSWHSLWQPQQCCPCLIAAGSESAGKAFSIITGHFTLELSRSLSTLIQYHGIDSGNLSNAVFVSLPLAQNQRGKRFRSSQAT